MSVGAGQVEECKTPKCFCQTCQQAEAHAGGDVYEPYVDMVQPSFEITDATPMQQHQPPRSAAKRQARQQASQTMKQPHARDLQQQK